MSAETTVESVRGFFNQLDAAAISPSAERDILAEIARVSELSFETYTSVEEIGRRVCERIVALDQDGETQKALDIAVALGQAASRVEPGTVEEKATLPKIDAPVTFAVIGAGNMGAGIAQKMATEGAAVRLVDRGHYPVVRGLASIEQTLQKGVERRIFTEERAAEILRLVEESGYEDLGDVDLVVEAVFENLGVKREVFANLAANTADDCILGTNTSSFRVEDIAEGIPHPERVVGLHFFYHPAMNRLVEIIPTRDTSPEVIARTKLAMEQMGKTWIMSADSPGFVVNRFFVPWLNEAVNLLADGVADIPTIDAVAKKVFRIGMGPFELMNVTGVPIALHSAETLGNAHGAFYQPARLLREQVESGKDWDLSGDPGTDQDDARAIADALLGAVFFASASLVSEGVGSIEDANVGAHVGLRWSKGPFELMNLVGIQKTRELVGDFCRTYGHEMPRILEEGDDPFHFEYVQTEIENGVARLTINRPAASNALNEEVMAQLDAALDTLEARDDVRVIALAGKGKSFVAGADIKWFVKKILAGETEQIVESTRAWQDTLNKLHASKKLTVALVDGLSLGGGSELALACDVRIATERGSFGFPETGLGIIPGLGGTQRLAKIIGTPLAKYFVLTGTPIRAELAEQLGIVDHLVERNTIEPLLRDLGDRVEELKQTWRTHLVIPEELSEAHHLFRDHSIAEMLSGSIETSAPPLAKIMKQLGYKGPVALRIAEELIDLSIDTDLEEGLEAELRRLPEIFQTADALAGLQSVLKRERPVFTGS